MKSKTQSRQTKTYKKDVKVPNEDSLKDEEVKDKTADTSKSEIKKFKQEIERAIRRSDKLQEEIREINDKIRRVIR